jgi:hypothetical protein
MFGPDELPEPEPEFELGEVDVGAAIDDDLLGVVLLHNPVEFWPL